MNFFFVRYRGRSMWPTFQEGDILKVIRILSDDIEIGDCILWKKPDGEETIVHRLIGTRPQLRTKGDFHSEEDDAPPLPAWIEGRIVSRIRFGRERNVRSGRSGIWAGRLNGLAGRINPESPGRGGKIARTIQAVSSPVFGIFTVITKNSKNETPVCRLRWSGHIIGMFASATEKTTLRWPYSIFLKHPHSERLRQRK